MKKSDVFYKSSQILKKLLKNYSSFEISTIDKFTQKIVRNFTYELGVNSKYEVEIDQNEVINKAVDNLISKIEINDESSNNIINFSSEKIQKDKSWDITNDLKEIARLIFNENNFSELDSLKNFQIKDFDIWKKELRLKIEKFTLEAKYLGEKAIKTIDEKQISHGSFLRNSIPKHFTKISKGEFERLYKKSN